MKKIASAMTTAAVLAVSASAAAGSFRFADVRTKNPDGGVVNAIVSVDVTSSMPVPLHLPAACTGCAFALVHVAEKNISSDDGKFTFDDPAQRFAEPVVVHLGTSDNDGSGNVPGALWSPSHDALAIAPVAADGTISAVWSPGQWFASMCNGMPCKGSVALTIVAGLVPADDPRGLLAHFVSTPKSVYHLIGATSANEQIALPGGVPSDALVYLGPITVSRVSSDNISVVLNGTSYQLGCSDGSRSGPAGALYSPIHAHRGAWMGSSPASGSLSVAISTGGWIGSAGGPPEVAVRVDGWVGGTLQGGVEFVPLPAHITPVPLDAMSNGSIALPPEIIDRGRTPDTVVAVVTAARMASDRETVSIGDQVAELATSTAHDQGKTAGAMHDAVHSDLVFVHPTLVGGTVSLPVSLKAGGWAQSAPDAGISVQVLGAFYPIVPVVSAHAEGGVVADSDAGVPNGSSDGKGSSCAMTPVPGGASRAAAAVAGLVGLAALVFRRRRSAR